MSLPVAIVCVSALSALSAAAPASLLSVQLDGGRRTQLYRAPAAAGRPPAWIITAAGPADHQDTGGVAADAADWTQQNTVEDVREVSSVRDRYRPASDTGVKHKLPSFVVTSRPFGLQSSPASGQSQVKPPTGSFSQSGRPMASHEQSHQRPAGEDVGTSGGHSNQPGQSSHVPAAGPGPSRPTGGSRRPPTLASFVSSMHLSNAAHTRPTSVTTERPKQHSQSGSTAAESEKNHGYRPPTRPESSFHRPPVPPNSGFHRPPARPDSGFRRPPTQSGSGFHRPPARPDNSFQRPPVRPDNSFHRPSIQPDSNFHRPPAQTGSGSHRPPAQPDSGFHGPPAQPDSGFHRPPAQPNSSFHRLPAQPDGSFHRPSAQPGSGFHRPPIQPGGNFHHPPAEPDSGSRRPDASSAAAAPAEVPLPDGGALDASVTRKTAADTFEKVGGKTLPTYNLGCRQGRRCSFIISVPTRVPEPTYTPYDRDTVSSYLQRYQALLAAAPSPAEAPTAATAAARHRGAEQQAAQAAPPPEQQPLVASPSEPQPLVTSLSEPQSLVTSPSEQQLSAASPLEPQPLATSSSEQQPPVASPIALQLRSSGPDPPGDGRLERLTEAPPVSGRRRPAAPAARRRPGTADLFLRMRRLAGRTAGRLGADAGLRDAGRVGADRWTPTVGRSPKLVQKSHTNTENGLPNIHSPGGLSSANGKLTPKHFLGRVESPVKASTPVLWNFASGKRPISNAIPGTGEFFKASASRNHITFQTHDEDIMNGSNGSSKHTFVQPARSREFPDVPSRAPVYSASSSAPRHRSGPAETRQMARGSIRYAALPSSREPPRRWRGLSEAGLARRLATADY